MFSGATAFDQDLSRWDVSRVRLGAAPMRHMFREVLSSSLSDCNKSRINAAWKHTNAKWPYASTWDVLQCHSPPPPPARLGSLG